MIKKLFFSIFILLAVATTATASESQGQTKVDIKFTKPTSNEQNPLQRTPAYVPDVFIDGHILSFEESCVGCPVTILDENENTVFSAIVDEDGIVTLPDSLTGTFVLELEWGSIIFEGEIEL